MKWDRQTLQIVSELLSIADLCKECPKVRQVVTARVEQLLAGNARARQPWEISPKVIQEILMEIKRGIIYMSTAVAKARLKKTDWTVRDVEIAVARRLVESEHYAAGASNTATYLHGLFREGEIFEEQCMGVAWWIPPTRSAAEATYPANWRGVLTLSRLAIRPDVPANACTFLLARSRRLIPADIWPCLVTYADEWRGHTGAIYRADNWEYVGKTKPERTYQIDGRMVARKAGGKTRTHAQMLALGAQMVGSFAKHKFVMIRNGKA